MQYQRWMTIVFFRVKIQNNIFQNSFKSKIKLPGWHVKRVASEAARKFSVNH